MFNITIWIKPIIFKTLTFYHDGDSYSPSSQYCSIQTKISSIKSANQNLMQHSHNTHTHKHSHTTPCLSDGSWAPLSQALGIFQLLQCAISQINFEKMIPNSSWIISELLTFLLAWIKAITFQCFSRYTGNQSASRRNLNFTTSFWRDESKGSFSALFTCLDNRIFSEEGCSSSLLYTIDFTRDQIKGILSCMVNYGAWSPTKLTWNSYYYWFNIR